jgi:hypothetical protein
VKRHSSYAVSSRSTKDCRCSCHRSGAATTTQNDKPCDTEQFYTATITDGICTKANTIDNGTIGATINEPNAMVAASTRKCDDDEIVPDGDFTDSDTNTGKCCRQHIIHNILIHNYNLPINDKLKS